MRVLITRPREDAEETACLLEERGVKVATESLLAIVPMAAPQVSIEGVQALLFSSANGVRAMSALIPERDIPAYTVGDASARAARLAGYKYVYSAKGDVNSLADLVKQELSPEDGKLLHPAANVVAGDLKGMLAEAGFSVDKVQMYESRPAIALTDSLIDAFRTASIDAAFFFSPRTAKTFVELAQKAGVDVSAVTAYGLSQAVANELAVMTWHAVRVAEAPEQDSLLAIFDQDREAGLIKAGQASALAEGTKGGGKPMSSGDKTNNNPEDAVTQTTDVVAAKAKAEAQDDAVHDRDLDIDSKPGDDAPETADTEDAATAKSGGGNGALVGVLMLAVAGLGGYASLPYWRDKVPEPYQSYLPEFPQSQTAIKMVDLQAAVDSNKAEVAKLQAELLAVSAQLEAAQSAEPSADLSAVVADLQEKVAGLTQRVVSLAETPVPNGKGATTVTRAELGDAVRHRIDLLAGKVEEQAETIDGFIAKMEEAQAGLVDGFDKVNTRLENVELTRADASSVLKLADRIGDVEKLAKAMVSRHDASLANLLAVVQLRAKAADGLPFDAELRTARALAEDKTEFDAKAGAFETMAGKGVATTAALRTAFDVLSATAAKAAAAPQGDNLLDKTLGRVMGLVTVRRMDGKDDGPSVNAMLARAETFLNAGDLAGAIQELKAIEAPAVAATLKPWLERAEARLALDAALSTLTADALARVAASAMQADVSAQKKGA